MFSVGTCVQAVGHGENMIMFVPDQGRWLLRKPFVSEFSVTQDTGQNTFEITMICHDITQLHPDTDIPKNAEDMTVSELLRVVERKIQKRRT